MAKAPLFSTYRQGENRVTSSMLAVFERIDGSYVERLVRALTGDELSMVRFENQSSGNTSIPDAAIRANFEYLFEVKTSRESVDVMQLRRHATSLAPKPTDARLLVITPDFGEPPAVAELRGEGVPVYWSSFEVLSVMIDSLLSDHTLQVSEREIFLLRELQALFEADGLLEQPEDVAVVAAGMAWSFYLETRTYMCPDERSFRPQVKHLAFYSSKAIHPVLPRILARRRDVPKTPEEAERLQQSDDPVDQLVAAALTRNMQLWPSDIGSSQQVFVLSGPEETGTVTLKRPITHHRKGPWMQGGQRYLSSETMLGAQTTEDLT